MPRILAETSPGPIVYRAVRLIAAGTRTRAKLPLTSGLIPVLVGRDVGELSGGVFVVHQLGVGDDFNGFPYLAGGRGVEVVLLCFPAAFIHDLPFLGNRHFLFGHCGGFHT